MERQMQKERVCPVCRQPVAAGANWCGCCGTIGLKLLFLTEQDYTIWLQRERERYKIDCDVRLTLAADRVCTELETFDREFVRDMMIKFQEFVNDQEKGETLYATIFRMDDCMRSFLCRDGMDTYIGIRRILKHWASTVYHTLTRAYTQELIQMINGCYEREMEQNGKMAIPRPFETEQSDNWMGPAFWRIFDHMECEIATGKCGSWPVSAQVRIFLKSKGGRWLIKKVQEEHRAEVFRKLVLRNRELLEQI